uniref:Uncharacterized protein n=1 Tax=Oryza nivara TaxID=4536 RepID=A0A0E0IPX8_ORYNI
MYLLLIHRECLLEMVGLRYHSDHRFCRMLTMHITAPALWESGAMCFAKGMVLWWQGLIRRRSFGPIEMAAWEELRVIPTLQMKDYWTLLLRSVGSHMLGGLPLIKPSEKVSLLRIA